MAGPDVLLQLRDVTQDYGGLRPLRIKSLDVRAGQRLAIMGLDQGAAEVLVNLMIGSTTPRGDEGWYTVTERTCLVTHGYKRRQSIG